MPAIVSQTCARRKPSAFRRKAFYPVNSGRLDLNQRPLRPERSALSKLSYAPWFSFFIGVRVAAARANSLSAAGRVASTQKNAPVGRL